MKCLIDYPQSLLSAWRSCREQHPKSDTIAVFLVATLVLTLSRDEKVYAAFSSLLSLDAYTLFVRPRALSFAFWLLAVPLLVDAIYLKRGWRALGLGLGNVGLAWPIFAALLVFFTVLAWGISQFGSFQSYYGAATLSVAAVGMSFASNFLHMLAWEFMNRGFLLQGLRRELGASAVYVQLLPFVLLHLGKPTFELYGSVAFGLFFGYYAYLTRSCLYGAFLHAWFASATEIFTASSG